jgi:uncharacterized protein YbjT (DUF2867 family)
MTKKKIILVTGATGAQGGGVAKALLRQGDFAVRILTRRANSPAAVALQAMGAQVVVGDMADEASLEQAMDGCYGVYGVTNFWEHYGQEYYLGMNLIEAVAVCGISHFVLHTLPDYSALSGGELKVPHCDIKAALKAYSQELRLPATYLQVAFYYENFLHFFPPQPDQFGTYQFGFPQGNTKLAMVSVEDVGGIAAQLFANPQAYLGKTVTTVGADDTCTEYAAAMTRILGLPVHYNYVPRDLYASFGFPGAEELANMFEVQRLYITSRQKEMEESYRLNPEMQTFERWLQQNKIRLLNKLQAHQTAVPVY